MEYGGILIFSLLSFAVVFLFVVLTSALGPKRPSPVKNEPFECGMTPEIKEGGVPTHFYVMGMLFIVFDVELAFLFPWAVSARKLGLFGLLEVVLFLFFVVLGYFYALKRGALEVE